MKTILLLFIASYLLSFTAHTQTAKKQFTREDTLMGSNTPYRSWWDVHRYDITVIPDYATKTIQGRATITYTVLTTQHSDYIQIDLQKPMQLDSIYFNGNVYINYPAKPYYQDGDHWLFHCRKHRQVHHNH